MNRHPPTSKTLAARFTSGLSSSAVRSSVRTVVLAMLTLHLRASDTDVIINEINYHPPFDLEGLQYIELFNRGPEPVNLAGWSFTKGVQFTFPEDSTLGPGAYLVICRDRTVFAANYGNQIPALGNFSGKLSHRGEKIELSNRSGQAVETIKYSDHAPWPAAPDGYSASLERICPFEPGNNASNWASSQLPPARRPAGTPGRKNDSFSPQALPSISEVTFKAPPPLQPFVVTADIADAKGIATAVLLWRTVQPGGESAESSVPLRRISGDAKNGRYQGTIEGQPPNTLVRFRLSAGNTAGGVRNDPSPNEPEPTYSFSTFVNSNPGRIAWAAVLNFSRPVPESRVTVWNGRPYQVRSTPTRGAGAFIYMPPGTNAVLTFDHVRLHPRKGGFKVHFPKDHQFKEMSGINVIFESSPRWLLSEPMAYEVYRLAGVPACRTEHIRVFVDGRPFGYFLLIEQPNKAFLAHNKRDDSGFLYKATWMGQGPVGTHPKRTRPATTYDDLVQVLDGMNRRSGSDQWNFVRQHFNVDEFASYYAVNMCIQNWDGFFNNYWVYHDTAGTGKWEIYPWDEDKTWGDYDGASPKYDWYEMPLTFGMRGDQSPRGGMFSGFFGGGPFGGLSWWRPPGAFSGPLLANPDFRKYFLSRLNTICTRFFTDEKLLPLINTMESNLEPEIPVRAQLTGQDPRQALQIFHNDIQSLRNQLKYRRQFILSELAKINKP